MPSLARYVCDFLDMRMPQSWRSLESTTDARNSAISMDSVETSTGRNEGRITRREQHDNDDSKSSTSINDNAIEIQFPKRYSKRRQGNALESATGRAGYPGLDAFGWINKPHDTVANLRINTGPQGHPRLAASQVPPARYHPDSPRWPLPWQARRPPEEPRPGCPPCYRSLQDQRCAPAQGQLPIRNRHIPEG